MRSLTWILPALLLAFSVGAVVEGVALYRTTQHNRLIQYLGRGQAPAVPDNAPLELYLAEAYRLQRKDRYPEAIEVFNVIAHRGGPDFRARVFYNLGTLHLAKAIALVDDGDTERAVPIVVLAKEAFRAALRLDNGYWDAKYNLEVAMRLVPEFAQVESGSETDEELQGRLWSSLPGFPTGLP